MAKAKKITSEELEKVQQAVSAFSRAKANIGELEYQKSQLLSQVMQLEVNVKQVQSELEEKYGSVTIDLTTGEYKEEEENAE